MRPAALPGHLRPSERTVLPPGGVRGSGKESKMLAYAAAALQYFVSAERLTQPAKRGSEMARIALSALDLPSTVEAVTGARNLGDGKPIRLMP